MNLTLRNLIDEAKIFCELMSAKNHVNLIGVTDGKAVGTYVEHEFKNYLGTRYVFTVGNSARGIDLPDENILTDIKVTSIAQPQSNCPCRFHNDKTTSRDARGRREQRGYYRLPA